MPKFNWDDFAKGLVGVGLPAFQEQQKMGLAKQEMGLRTREQRRRELESAYKIGYEYGPTPKRGSYNSADFTDPMSPDAPVGVRNDPFGPAEPALGSGIGGAISAAQIADQAGIDPTEDLSSFGIPEPMGGVVAQAPPPGPTGGLGDVESRAVVGGARAESEGLKRFFDTLDSDELEANRAGLERRLGEKAKEEAHRALTLHNSLIIKWRALGEGNRMFRQIHTKAKQKASVIGTIMSAIPEDNTPLSPQQLQAIRQVGISLPEGMAQTGRSAHIAAEELTATALAEQRSAIEKLGENATAIKDLRDDMAVFAKLMVNQYNVQQSTVDRFVELALTGNDGWQDAYQAMLDEAGGKGRSKSKKAPPAPKPYVAPRAK